MLQLLRVSAICSLLLAPCSLLSQLQTITANGDLQGKVAFSGDITPAQITANQNDYNPTGLSGAAVLRLSTDASRNITGLQGGSDGRILIIANVGSFPLVLVNASGLSTAAYRFAFTTDVTLAAGGVVPLIYDSTASRWRLAAQLDLSGTFQPLDATLTALAGVTTAADKLIYATGIDAFSTTDLTAFGRAQLGISTLTSTALLLGAGAGAITAADITYSTPTLTVPTNFGITSTQSAIARFTSNQTDARVELYESSTRRMVVGYNTTNIVLSADGARGVSITTGATGNNSITLTPSGTGGIGIGGAQLGTDMLTVVGRANMSAGLEWSWRHTDGVSYADLGGTRADANNGYLSFRTRGNGAVAESFRIGQTNLAAWGTTGARGYWAARTYTDTSTSSSGTAASAVFNSYAQPTLAASNTTVTTTVAANVYIAGDVIAGTNQTLTASYGLWNAGKTRLDGAVTVNSSISATGLISGLISTTYASGTNTAHTFQVTGGANADGTSTIVNTSFIATVSGSNASTSAIGQTVDVYNTSSATLSSATIQSSGIRATSSGSISTAFGYRMIPILSGAGNITNITYYEARAPSVSSTGDIVGTSTGFLVNDIGRSSASVVTGVSVAALTKGSGNAYGYRGQVASASGKWNLYMDGTAANYLAGELWVGSATDAGAYALQVTGAAIFSSTITTAAAVAWDLGAASVTSPTAPNRTLAVVVAGTTYYLHAKTTND